MTLSEQQLTEITGLRRPSAIRRWLDNQRLPYLMGADGWPRVLESIIVSRLGGAISQASTNEPKLRLKNG